MLQLDEYKKAAKNGEVERLRKLFARVTDSHMSEAGKAYAKKAAKRGARRELDNFTLEKALRVHWRAYDYDAWTTAMDKMADALNLQSCRIVFEAGFGSGAPLGYFNQKFPELGVSGNDLYEPYIELANNSEHIADGAFLQINSTHLDFIPDNSLDAAFSWGAVCYETPEKASMVIKHLIRICKPGGRILVGNIENAKNLRKKSYRTPYKAWFTREELRQEIAGQPVTILKLNTDRKVMGLRGHHSSSRLTICMEKNH